jgi:hypothetical protein
MKLGFRIDKDPTTGETIILDPNTGEKMGDVTFSPEWKQGDDFTAEVTFEPALADAIEAEKPAEVAWEVNCNRSGQYLTLTFVGLDDAG